MFHSKGSQWTLLTSPLSHHHRHNQYVLLYSSFDLYKIELLKLAPSEEKLIGAELPNIFRMIKIRIWSNVYFIGNIKCWHLKFQVQRSLLNVDFDHLVKCLEKLILKPFPILPNITGNHVPFHGVSTKCITSFRHDAFSRSTQSFQYTLSSLRPSICNATK